MGLVDSVMDVVTGGASGRARDSQQQAIDALNGIVTPDVAAQQLALQQFQSAGNYTPQQLQNISQQNSLMGGISTDPRLHQAQLSALTQLQGLGQNGMTLQDQANMAQMQSQVAQQNKGAQDAIMQNMAQRGVAGSGMELASRLSAQQAATQQAAQQGLNIQAQAQARALQALQASGTQAGAMQNTAFNQAAQQAQAQDAINRFNAQNAQSTAQYNTGNANQAQQYNLGNAQNVMNSNTQLANQQQQYNKQLQQQQFNNQMQLAGAKAGQYAGAAGLANQQAGANAGFVGNLISAGATAAASGSGSPKQKQGNSAGGGFDASGIA